MVDSFSEFALVSIAPQGYGELLFQTLTETIDTSGGEKDVNFIPNIAGGNFTKKIPHTPEEITLELYPLEVGTASWPITGAPQQVFTATGVFDLIDGAVDADAVQPQIVEFDHARLPVRLTLMWTDSYAITNPTAATASLVKALRISYAEGYVTSAPISFTDGILKQTVTIKFPPFNKSAVSCVRRESTDGTADKVLPALAAYTSTVKFVAP